MARNSISNASIRSRPMIFLLSAAMGYGMLAGDSNMTVDSGNRLVAQDVIAYLEAIRQVDAKVDGRIVFFVGRRLAPAKDHKNDALGHVGGRRFSSSAALSAPVR